MENNNLNEPQFRPTSFAMNPEPRCSVVILCDTSGSMDGQPIAELNTGLIDLKNDLLADPLASKRVEVAVVSFPPVKVECDFQLPGQFTPPRLAAAGDTPLGAAILTGMQLTRDRKELYKANGIQYYRPWIFLLTDGVPTDNWHEAARLVHAGEAAGSFVFFSVGVQKADMNVLRQLSSARPPLKLSGVKFRELFLWLSASVKGVAAIAPGTPVSLPSTEGWTKV